MKVAPRHVRQQQPADEEESPEQAVDQTAALGTENVSNAPTDDSGRKHKDDDEVDHRTRCSEERLTWGPPPEDPRSREASSKSHARPPSQVRVMPGHRPGTVARPATRRHT